MRNCAGAQEKLDWWTPGMRDTDLRRWLTLAVLATAELLGMSPWFAASAVSPHLQALWNLDASETGFLTTAVQIGFVAGTAVAAVLNLADVFPAKGYFAISALTAAAANAALVAAP